MPTHSNVTQTVRANTGVKTSSCQLVILNQLFIHSNVGLRATARSQQLIILLQNVVHKLKFLTILLVVAGSALMHAPCSSCLKGELPQRSNTFFLIFFSGKH